MIVRCEHTRVGGVRQRTADGWLTVGNDYVVLEIAADRYQGIHLRLLSESQKVPALFKASMFSVVSAAVPSLWTVQLTDKGGLYFGPEVWLRPGFWEQYFDGDVSAVAAFDEVAARLIAEA